MKPAYAHRSEGKCKTALQSRAEAYADQNEQDHAALLEAVRSGRLKAIVESDR